MNMGLKAIAVAVALGVGTLYGLAGIVHINPGEAGIKIKMIGSDRGMQPDTLSTGMSWVEPFIYDVVVYDYRLRQEIFNDIPTQTKDGQPIIVDLSVEMGLEPAKLPWLHEHIGPDYYDQVVYPAVRSAIRDEVPSELSDEIYTADGRVKVQQRIQEALRKIMEPRGINIRVNLRDIDFTNKQFIATLEEKAGAAQKVIIETRNAEAAEQTARKMANIAEGEKQKRIRAAEAKQQEIALEGLGQQQAKEAEAKGNLAIYLAEAKGIEAKRQAYAGAGGSELVSIAWAENMGPNVKVFGIPTGSPGTTSLMDLNGILGGALKGIKE